MKTSSNPTLSRKAIARLAAAQPSDGTVLTLPGIAQKSLLLLLLVMGSAAYTWRTAALQGVDAVMGAAMIGCLGGLVVAIFTRLNPSAAPVTAPIYAVLEGLIIGTISYMTNARYHGIPLQAAAATLSVAAVCLGLFAADRIEVTETFAEKVAIGMMGILAVYLVELVLTWVGVPLGSAMDRGVFGFVINAAAIGLAIMCLFVDFAEIEAARREKLSAKSEWYFAFSIIVTLLWLYIEILRMMRRFRR